MFFCVYREDFQTIISSSDPVCPVGYINFTKLRLIPKTSRENEADVVVKKSIDYISDLNESSYSDLSDPDLSETELEFIEMENRMKESMSKEEIANMSRSNSLSHGSLLSSPVRILTKKFASDEEPTTTITTNGTSTVKNGLLDTKSITTNNQDQSGDDILSKNVTFNFDIEQRPLENKPNVAINPRGWMWIAGIQGTGTTSKEGMQNAIDILLKIVSENDYELSNLCYVSLYVRSMNDYAELNDVYVKAFNFQNPPSRVCIESPLPDGLQVIMEAVAFRPRYNDINNQRHTMHVQSISHWAPANIGPYSQSTKVGEITYIAGTVHCIINERKCVIALKFL